MPAGRLTPKQERFCIEYFKTGNASEAYRISYNASKMKETSINRTAFALLQDIKITARVDELKNKAEKRAVTSKGRAVEILSEISEESQDKDRISAVKQLCKIFGWEAPTKQEVNLMPSPWDKYHSGEQS